MPALLQRLDDFKLVFWKHAPEPVRPLDRLRGINRNVIGIDFLGEHLGGNQEMTASVSAQQGPPGCNWKKYLYAQDAAQQGKIDTNMLNQMSALASAQGYSLTNKVLQTCNGWLMEAKRADGSPAVLFVDPKARTIIDADFR